jgi:hypothetical protein
MYRYKLRMYYYRLWRKRVHTESIGTCCYNRYCDDFANFFSATASPCIVH